MKRIFPFTFMAIVLIFSTQIRAQEFSGLDKSPLDIASYPTDYKVSEKNIRITYSRPQLKGRSLSELAPIGKVWRTGANEAPEITFYKDVNFGGKKIKAGVYALLTIPGEKEWTIILHNNLNQWGSYFYDETSDIARVTGEVSIGKKLLEEFSITFQKVEDGVHMLMGWDKIRVAVPITM